MFSHYFNLFVALTRGSYYILFYRLFKPNVKIGFPLIAYGKLRIVGPGKVEIGRKTTVAQNVFRGLEIVTYSNRAKVTIGGKGLLAGLVIRCSERIHFGEKVMTAVSLIQDSLFVYQNIANNIAHQDDLLETAPITIGNNVWIGGQVAILKGTVIGDDCVLSAGTVCHDIEMNNYSLGSGNPMKRPLPIEQLVAMRKRNV